VAGGDSGLRKSKSEVYPEKPASFMMPGMSRIL